jgi:hypothetical protein
MQELSESYQPRLAYSVLAGTLRLSRCVIATSAVCLCACGGSDSSSGVSVDPSVQAGFFRGGNVAGLDYVSGTQAGTTNEGGAYTCEKEHTITFSVGSVILGETDCVSVAHAAALTDSGSLTDRAALNITRFLMMLDRDQAPENGISISEPLRSIADSWNQIDFSATDFEGELVRVASDIASVEGRVASAPDEAAAFVFLDASLSCAYSGVYAVAFNSVSVALSVFRNRDTNVDLGNLFVISQDPSLVLFLDSSSEVALETLPNMGNSEFSAYFVSPDVVMGSWLTAATLEDTDRTGDLLGHRLGYIDGTYRFVGNVLFEPPFGTSRRLIARIELSLDGDTLKGRVFNLLLQVRLEVTGRRLADSNQFEIEVGSIGNATVTVILDANGEPIALEGNWPGYEESVLEAVSCRLT